MEKRATQILEDEHHLIQQVVGAMAALADRVTGGEGVDREMLVNVAEFMGVFVEKCHHEKEEQHLFPLLAAKGVPVAGCPIGMLSHEHQSAAKLSADLAAAVEGYLKDPAGTGPSLATVLRSVVSLMPTHIWKEDYLLFPMTDKILNDREQEGLVEQFEGVERGIGPDVHHRFEQLAVELAARAQGA